MVQQLPLFNLLEPEELDWQVFRSRIEGKTRLDTRVPEKFALVKALFEGMGLKMPFGDGLKDAIWRCDRILSGDRLRDAIWKCDRTLSGMGL